ncbi:hypothetical protein OKW21_003101 [Catalinimonas alkaloidigena]|nr:hypothetical protein [Catalinimonas alkaloidigena]
MLIWELTDAKSDTGFFSFLRLYVATDSALSEVMLKEYGKKSKPLHFIMSMSIHTKGRKTIYRKNYLYLM